MGARMEKWSVHRNAVDVGEQKWREENIEEKKIQKNIFH